MFEQIKISAKQRGTSVSEVIAMAVAEHLSQSNEQIARMDALARRVDDNHRSVMSGFDNQLIKLGELVAMVLPQSSSDIRAVSGGDRLQDRINSYNNR